MTDTQTTAPVYRNYINGEWKDSATGNTVSSINPANRHDVVGIVPPGRFTLQPGDRIEIEITGIGTLVNPVAAASAFANHK